MRVIAMPGYRNRPDRLDAHSGARCGPLAALARMAGPTWGPGIGVSQLSAKPAALPHWVPRAKNFPSFDKGAFKSSCDQAKKRR